MAAAADYYSMLIPLPEDGNEGGMTDISRRLIKESALHKTLSSYMASKGLRYVQLTHPRSRPSTYDTKRGIPFLQRFPAEYVEEFEGMLAQSGDVIVINPVKHTAEVVHVLSDTVYNSALLSLFVQSIQQVNPTSRMLYSMVGRPPAHGVGRFVSSETSQCCFKYIIVGAQKGYRGVDEFDLRLYVANHINHTCILDLESVAYWFSSEHSMV